MVAKNKAAASKGQIKKLKLKKETIRGLAVKRTSEVKGGAGAVSRKVGTVQYLCPD